MRDGSLSDYEFAIATHSRLLTCQLDNGFNLQQTSEISGGYHYGISTVDPVAVPGEGAAFYALYGGLDVSTQNINALRLFEKRQDSWIQRDEIALGDRVGAVHQILSLGGEVLIANTKRNSVTRLHGTEVVEEYFIDGIDFDVNHINSLFVYGQYLFVVLHNKLQRESQIAVLEYQGSFSEVARYSLWDAQCHNIFIHGSYIYYNGSSRKCVVKADWTNGNIIERTETEHHTKGMSVVDHYLVVGGSVYARRSERSSSDGFLYFLNRNTLSVEHIVEVSLDLGGTSPSGIGNINDIRSLRQNEQAERQVKVTIDPRSMQLARTDLSLLKSRIYWNVKRSARSLLRK